MTRLATVFRIGTVAMGIFASSCTTVHQLPTYDLQLPPVDRKLPLQVRLVLSNEYLSTQTVWKAVGETHVTPLGDNLSSMSKRLIDNVFSFPSADLAAPSLDHTLAEEYTLEPRIVLLEQSTPVWKGQEVKSTVGIEWKLSSAGGNVIWIETVQGNSNGPAGYSFNAAELQRKYMVDAVKDAFLKTQQAMLSSRVLMALH